MVIMWMSVCFILLYGIWEQYHHQKRLRSIAIRINVNGIRGKSTVTRLITSVVKEAGYKTVGKTTGTSARIIYWYTDEERPIKRRPEGPNIGEQRRVVKEVATLGAEALVCECMAVKPDYQLVFQEKLVQANIGVIVNVLEDHMDVMGPTLDNVAEAFTATIPYGGHLVTIDGPYLEYFKQVAQDRGTKVVVADNTKISEEYLRQFGYMVFPDNASIALAVAEVLGIDEEIALQGMLHAQPDPGAMRITRFGDEENSSFFVNGFAANDASSTLRIWERVEMFGYSDVLPIVIMNCRADRVDRTEQFARDVLPYIEAEVIIAIGETTSPIIERYKQGAFQTKELWDLTGWGTKQIMDKLLPYTENRIVYGVGNIHGDAEPLIEAIMKMSIKREKQAS
ncbi:poly-gamma-glutamate synthase PgsB [Priestia taiwanensis]|uniref:PGA synthase CapB n=1 Tax=Priestia taiwanensis TaxID=1347902 RepID=A0A917AXK9_9BACI|nr:poly-gamma-glutamate synthase PgsB [Priestia taiwanensis]MBM7365027.1 poly-gamma-glutamate synthase PgsB/CapB [Priestia taiwanensis]GGE83470.1 PGA synthase CapB [Priestia taiwanensis]